MDVLQPPRLAVVRVATIHPADLDLPDICSIDLSHLVIVESASAGSG
ncbi:hypothetical protein [Microbacterium sp. 2MCAF23]